MISMRVCDSLTQVLQPPLFGEYAGPSRGTGGACACVNGVGCSFVLEIFMTYQTATVRHVNRTGALGGSRKDRRFYEVIMAKAVGEKTRQRVGTRGLLIRD